MTASGQKPRHRSRGEALDLAADVAEGARPHRAALPPLDEG